MGLFVMRIIIIITNTMSGSTSSTRVRILVIATDATWFTDKQSDEWEVVHQAPHIHFDKQLRHNMITSKCSMCVYHERFADSTKNLNLAELRKCSRINAIPLVHLIEFHDENDYNKNNTSTREKLLALESFVLVRYFPTSTGMKMMQVGAAPTEYASPSQFFKEMQQQLAERFRLLYVAKAFLKDPFDVNVNGSAERLKNRPLEREAQAREKAQPALIWTIFDDTGASFKLFGLAHEVIKWFESTTTAPKTTPTPEPHLVLGYTTPGQLDAYMSKVRSVYKNATLRVFVDTSFRLPKDLRTESGVLVRDLLLTDTFIAVNGVAQAEILRHAFLNHCRYLQWRAAFQA